MPQSQTLKKYQQKFENLKVNKNKYKYSVGKAPHKPILLLSLITLHKNNKINLANIEPNIYLREIWSEFWELLEYDRTGPIHLPLYHMKSDGFWNLELKKDITPHQPKSLNQFADMMNAISLNEELIDLINDNETRASLINSLLNGGYFSEQEIQSLNKKIESIDESFEYEEKINSMIRKEFCMNQEESISDIITVRNPAFRRVVLSAYEETCAICDMKIITSYGISVIDAAHILPFSQFKNDDIRNGVALCKTHHWLFDRGLITVDPHYRVMVSKSIDDESPKNILSCYDRKDLMLPDDADLYPSSVALGWHRENVFHK